MALQQGSYLVLLGDPGVPSLPASLGGLFFLADPLVLAGQSSAGGFLQSLGIPMDLGCLEREKEGPLTQGDRLLSCSDFYLIVLLVETNLGAF